MAAKDKLRFEKEMEDYTPPSDDDDENTKDASIKAPKRKYIRPKCSAPNCDNRVVNSGVCVTHGAKRKLCSHPGCTKAVKVAGACSMHGPARKKCDTEGCTRVAVQGGKCLSHGGKKKLCSFEECKKNIVVGGMCKKHYDAVNGVAGADQSHIQNTESCCIPVGSDIVAAKKNDTPSEKEEEPKFGGDVSADKKFALTVQQVFLLNPG